MGEEHHVVHKSVKTSGKKKEKESFVVNREDRVDGWLRNFFQSIKLSLIIHDLNSGIAERL